MNWARSAPAPLVGVGVVVLWAAAAGLASRIPVPATQDESADGQSVVSRVFGSSREVISRQFYAEADRFFHKGVSGHPDRAFDDHLFLRWADAISPTRHEELQGDEIAEIMPWLRLATGADPRNVEAYSTAAYWLGARGELDAARIVLEEARGKNPVDYRVPLSLAKLYSTSREHERALKELEIARSLWPAGADPRDQQTQLDRAAILSFRAGALEALGRQSEAIASFRELLTEFPDRHQVRKRLDELEHGRQMTESAHTFWKNQFSQIDAQGDAGHLAGGGGGHAHDHPHDGSHDHHDPDHEARHDHDSNHQ